MSNRHSTKSGGYENSTRASKSTVRGRRDSQKGTTSRGGPRSSKASGRGSRLNGPDSGTIGARSKIQILDENGVDVTPKSMLHLKTSTAPEDGVQGTPGTSNPASEQSEAYTMERMSMSARFSRSDKTQEGSARAEGIEQSPDIRPGNASDTNRDQGNETQAVPEKNDKKPRPGVGEHGDQEIGITLCESNTFWLLHMVGRCVASDSPEAVAVEEANGRYRTLLKGRQGSELYADVGIQTVNNIFKAKEVQSISETCADQISQTTGWEIYDALQSSQAEASQDGFLPDGHSATSEQRKQKLGKKTERSDTPTNINASSSLDLMDLDSALSNMEKVVLQNVYHDKMLLYRDHQVAYESSTDSEREIVHLWNFSSPETEGRNVSCVAWNKSNPDLLAVGYGEFDFTSQRDGLVAFWSLKNPEFPEWTFTTPYGVTALDFSSTNFNLLAVGLYDGTVAIYDIRAPTDKAILQSGNGVPGKHTDPVWKVRWIKRGADKDEALVSISTDGRVTQWSLKKGLEYIDLMKLKRVARKTTVATSNGSSAPQTEAFISRRGSGTCFDFSSKDRSIYVTGTEDGMLHKCSCSYSEQYLESYYGHSGPIHQVKWSPFASNVFLSASADWTIKLWSEESADPILTFQSGNEQISDVAWSPKNSTVFASTSWDGRLEVWDLSMSTLKPVMSTTVAGEKLSCALFSETSPIVVAGGNRGTVGVYRIIGIESPEDDAEGRRLRSAMASNF